MTVLGEQPDPVSAPTGHDDWVIKVEGLGKIYGPGGADAVEGTGPEFGRTVSPLTGAVVAAWDVNFDVVPGEALGVIGESGSGKSSVMRCIAGDVAATVGDVRLRSVDDGATDILRLSPGERRALRIDHLSVVYQDPAEGLDLGITAGGNVADRLVAAGERNFGRIRDRAGMLLDRTEVPLDRMDDLVRTFSGGMRQRVQLAKALANQPPVLLLDELGIGAVVVSHDFSVIEMLTRRVLVMHHGRVVETGLTDQLLEDPQHPYSQRLVAAARG